jgi:hypothetical protein
VSNEPGNPYAPPKAADDGAPAAPAAYASFDAELRGDTRGRRIAGRLMLANAALFTLAAFAPGAPPQFLSIGMDLAVGLTLVRGFGFAANLALFRLAVGMFFAVAATVSGTWQHLILAVPEAVGLVLLLLGVAGGARLIAGCVLFALYYAAQLAAVVALFAGRT